MRIYLAGPLGFSEAGRHFKDDVLIPALQRLGHRIIDPWVLTDPAVSAAIQALPPGRKRRAAWQAINPAIGRQNVAAITRCQVVVAILDGVDVDSGTAAEIGFAFAKGKRIVGYRGDFRLASDNEGLVVNLQVEYFIRDSGGDIATDISGLLRMVGPAAEGRRR
jgi:nucleoside 2-deoxyribosyltransferase